MTFSGTAFATGISSCARPAWFAEDDNPQAKLTAQSVLAHVLFVALRLLHPFMPFITEELYLSLPHEKTSIMFESWPKPDDALRFSADEADMEKIMGAINAIRARRSEMNVPPSRRAALFIETKGARPLCHRHPLLPEAGRHFGGLL